VFKDGKRSNHILDAMPAAERKRLASHLDLVKMPLGAVIHEAGAPQTLVYFPIDCVVSLLTVFRDGKKVETGLVGREGVVGLPLFLG